MSKKSILFFLLFSIVSFSYCINAFGPYLQCPTRTSIRVLWKTDLPTESIIALGKEPNKWDSIYTFSSKKMYHKVEFVGLEPNTKYYYAQMENGKVLPNKQGEGYFTTLPLEAKPIPFRVWCLGDFGKATEQQRAVRLSFEAYNKDNPTNFWIWLGDNAYNTGKEIEYQEKVFSSFYGYDSIMKFLPFMPCPGNHDYGSVSRWGGPKKHKGPYFKLFDVYQKGEAGGVASGTELYYSYNYGNAHFISLNSEVWAYNIFGNTAMKNWLINDLKNNHQLFTIVYFHRPPYSKGSHDSDTFWEIFTKAMRKRFVPILEEYGEDLVLCGHTHVYERSFLIKGHYGHSNTFDAKKHIISSSFGNTSKGDLPYVKFANGKNANKGTIYLNCGVGGRPYDTPRFGHPIMAVEAAGSTSLGSVILDFNGEKLVTKYLKGDGSIGDEFTIIKYTKTGQQKKKKVANL